MILAIKIIKIPKFYDSCPKINKIAHAILHHFARKIPEFYIIIARIKFSPRILGARVPLPPSLSYAYEHQRLFLTSRTALLERIRPDILPLHSPPKKLFGLTLLPEMTYTLSRLFLIAGA